MVKLHTKPIVEQSYQKGYYYVNITCQGNPTYYRVDFFIRKGYYDIHYHVCNTSCKSQKKLFPSENNVINNVFCIIKYKYNTMICNINKHQPRIILSTFTESWIYANPKKKKNCQRSSKSKLKDEMLQLPKTLQIFLFDSKIYHINQSKYQIEMEQVDSPQSQVLKISNQIKEIHFC
ncbi:hypothetical protein TTHERM_000011208 (macronuclear) [Tetrahymena thermophila SB210]|uniref:Uncharacterized protein n=1 Tax=Tetrahymena thermophila (strain SB210) TaxID=312017 RepID=W7XAC5_TETTS|nr:hypothetical protein TTHERM_000011208 [Tetrahymena thermophila SB210]EWS76325.1 hypothetical protein TTHERM_000011208 [Tetrahymena thermophila SB210]|eukprot:XP_012651109.1 hypothetical protein TTHERM_000011208 [Tetrahymena thermophila SB210]